MTKHLLRDLQNLSQELLGLTRQVEEALSQSLRAILTREAALARQIIDGDAEIDAKEVQLEEDALKILALHQPVASDLRFIIAAIKINNDLERIADIAATIAKRALDLVGMEPVEPPEDFELMAEKSRRMVRKAIRALVERSVDEARAVRAMDDEVDDLEKRLLGSLKMRMQDCPREHADPLMRWHTVVRSVERIADLATNVAEDVIYMIEGEIVRHRVG